MLTKSRLFLLLIIFLVCVISYQSYAPILGLLAQKKSALALKNHDSETALAQATQAVIYLPHNPSTHLQLSQTQFIIASGIAQKSPLTSEDRQIISDLLNLSIKEAKTAISLDQNSLQAWHHLATLYATLAQISSGSIELARQTYEKLLSLDPSNSDLHSEYADFLVKFAQPTGVDPSGIEPLTSSMP